MMTTIFLDESGHSGDMINSGNSYNFKGQPYFALAGIGLEDGHNWEAYLTELRSRHRIPSGELKSKALVSKPKFSADVLNALIEQKAPLFVEIVDKRFFICTSIVSFQLLPPCLGYPDGTELHAIKNKVADFLYFHASEQLLNTFVMSCLIPGHETLLASLASLRLLANQPGYPENAVQITQVLAHIVDTTEAEYQELSVTEYEAWLLFLPPPDMNRHSKQVWMLPNLTSFTNIYARLNLYYRRDLANIQLVHDQQLEVENILRHSKAIAEQLDKDLQLPYTPHSDYRFESVAPLAFAQSNELVGVQLADIVAGAIMRFFRDAHAGREVSRELRDAIL